MPPLLCQNKWKGSCNLCELQVSLLDGQLARKQVDKLAIGLLLEQLKQSGTSLIRNTGFVLDTEVSSVWKSNNTPKYSGADLEISGAGFKVDRKGQS